MMDHNYDPMSQEERDAVVAETVRLLNENGRPKMVVADKDDVASTVRTFIENWETSTEIMRDMLGDALTDIETGDPATVLLGLGKLGSAGTGHGWMNIQGSVWASIVLQMYLGRISDETLNRMRATGLMAALARGDEEELTLYELLIASAAGITEIVADQLDALVHGARGPEPVDMNLVNRGPNGTINGPYI
jgi:hypothetical protein